MSHLFVFTVRIVSHLHCFVDKSCLIFVTFWLILEIQCHISTLQCPILINFRILMSHFRVIVSHFRVSIVTFLSHFQQLQALYHALRGSYHALRGHNQHIRDLCDSLRGSYHQARSQGRRGRPSRILAARRGTLLAGPCLGCTPDPCRSSFGRGLTSVNCWSFYC